MSLAKLEWQRRQRRTFRERFGYSLSAHYGTGGLRETVLIRDGRRCVQCGMTAEDHLAEWSRPITIDHRDKDRSHNALDNLQTLCLRCHGRKDISPILTMRKTAAIEIPMQHARRRGATYQTISERFGVSIATAWKWTRSTT